MPKKPGMAIELGDEIGHPMEPHKRHGRIVGIRNDDCPAIEQFIYRLYQPGDRLGIPTGGYQTSWLIVAYEGPHE
jgi:hypothetical protein